METKVESVDTKISRESPHLVLTVVGAGLSGSLVALASRYFHPERVVHLYDPQDLDRKSYTWSLHDSDIPDPLKSWFLQKIVDCSWTSYEVRFPKYKRRLSLGYHSVLSESLYRKIRQDPKIHLFSKSYPRDQVEEHHSPVLWCTGWSTDPEAQDSPSRDHRGYQKFVGWDIEMQEPHGLRTPLLMDACLEQVDGFRFMYQLPFSDRKLLVEDTVYSTNSSLSEEIFETRIQQYIEKNYPSCSYKVLRKEKGVLPIPWKTPDVEEQEDPRLNLQTAGTDRKLMVGAHGHYFQPVTGYTLPYVLKQISALFTDASNSEYGDLSQVNSVQRPSQLYYFLNYLMFHGSQDHFRYKMLEKFYQLPEETIRNFYRGELTYRDWFTKIFWGRPPIPLHRAIGAFLKYYSPYRKK